ncbi:uncharacterized protein LOC117107421 isoform X2 [Anneissia japonica]|uniref:uncharacterized protein LOC117107421 isoform X2 n=1 Tax=Anneissia japonica TaxID=1529436 RepID=UPI001425696C|nr:uncharacterized protein LOC117107421 isoform X2 [Anneissia japonica]
MDQSDILRYMDDSRTVLITGIRHMKGCREDKLELYFARKSNGGGDVDGVDLVDEDTAVLTFDDEAVAASFMDDSKQHVIADAQVFVESSNRKQHILQEMLAPSPAVSHTQVSLTATGTRKTMIANDILRSMEDSRSVLVTGIRHMKGCREDKLELYFARRSNGGGDVDRVDLVDDDTAVVTFDDEAVAASIMGSLKQHFVSDTRVSVESAQCKQQYNGFTGGQLPNQYHMSDAEIHCSGSRGFSYSKQLSSSGSEFNSTDLPEEADSQEYSMDYTDSDEDDSQEYSMDYTDSVEDVLPTRTGPENGSQRIDSNQPISIPCTEDVLSYIQTVHFDDLNRIQKEHKVTFDIKNRTTVLVQSAANPQCNIPQAVKELKDLMKVVMSKAEKDEVTLTPDEADSKNYAAAVRDLLNSTSLLVKNNGRRFSMFGTRPVIDAAKKKLKDMLGSTTKSSTNVHYQGHTLQSGGKKMTTAERVVKNSKDQLPRSEKENRSLKPPSSSSNYIRPSSSRNSIPKSQQQVPKQMAISNEAISIHGTKEVFNYIQTVHFNDLNRIQNKHKVTLEQKNGTTVSVKSAVASANVQCIHNAVKEIKDLIKDIESEAETDEFTLTSDEADSKNYSAALKEFKNSTSLLVTKGNGKTFLMYGKRSAIDAAKTKLRQMLGCPIGIAPSTNTHCSGQHLKSEGSKRNIAEQVVKTSSYLSKDQVPRIGQENPSSSITPSKSMYNKPKKRTSRQQDNTRGAAKGTKRFENQSLDSVDGSIYSTTPEKQSLSQSQIGDNPRQMVGASVKPKIRPNSWQAPRDHHDETSERAEVFETKIHDVKVIGRKSDILDEFATVIVCCANRKLQCDSGLAARISQLCGPRVQSQCDKWIEKHGPVAVGDVVWVDIDDGIACSHLINAVVPRWNGYRSGTEELLLSEMFMKVFTAARDKLGAHIIALPLIGIATCGIPRQIYAKSFTNALLEFLEQPTLPMQEIRIVDLDETVIRLIANELQVDRHSHRYSRPTNGSFSTPNPAMITALSGPEFLQRDVKSYNGSGARPRLPSTGPGTTGIEKCPVCLEPYHHGKKIISNCFHACCKRCYKELKKSSAHCPVCRGPLN